MALASLHGQKAHVREQIEQSFEALGLQTICDEALLSDQSEVVIKKAKDLLGRLWTRL